MVIYEIKISGKVQGVGFRYFVQKRAAEFKIQGWVKNTPDGGVLVTAQGHLKEMNTFLDYLRTGPPLARVLKVVTSEIPGGTDFSDFRVKY